MQKQKIKWASIISILLFALYPSGSLFAGENKEIGISPSAEYGTLRLAMPVSPSRHLTIGAHGGYGFIESMGPVTGGHHRMFGNIAVSGSPIEILSLKLSLSGYNDIHPSDETGKDNTTVGAPILGIRMGGRLGDFVQLGGAVEVFIPGNEAPSLAFDATTLEPKILFALAPREADWRMLFMVGYRWDNSYKTAPSSDSLRPGDRISIGTSEFDSIPIGLGGSYSFGPTELLAEITSNLLVGSNAPTGDSPIRLGIGVRHRILSSLQLSLLTETLLAGRPPLSSQAPIIPIEPRFTVQFGVTYTFDFGKTLKASNDSHVVVDNKGKEEGANVVTPPGPNTTSLDGRVVDEEGNPVGGTNVKLTITDSDGVDKSFETTTDPTGTYALTDLPVGAGVLSIATQGYDPIEETILLSDEPTRKDPDILKQSVQESETQLRGQIRSIDGNPLRAKLTIRPKNTSVETDEDGFFSIDLPNGNYRVTITAPGYNTQKKRVVIDKNSVTIINVDLRPVKK